MTTRPSAGRRILSRRPDGLTLLLAGLGILGAALALAREINSGVGLLWDEVNYISVARSLLAGDGFIQFNGSIYSDWPPLYPLLLAGSGLGVFDPLTVAGPLNAAIFGLTVFIAGIYLRTRLESRLLLLGGVLALALAGPLLAVATWAASEPLFILLCLLAWMQADRALSARDARSARSALVWAGVFTALACLTRYMGITVVMALAPLLALQRGVALPEKAQRIIIYMLLALAPLGLWMLRNQLLVGSLTGGRDYPVAVSLAEVLRRKLNIITGWLFPEPPIWYFALPADYTFLLGAVGVALLAIVLGRALWAHCQGVGNAARNGQLVFAGFAALYIAAVIGAFVQGFTSNIHSTRYLVPAYLPLLLTALLALDPALRQVRQWRRRQRRGWRRATAVGASVILIAGLVLWLAWQIPVNARTIIQVNGGQIPLEGYPNYAYARWADSAALRYLRAEITDGVVFSNRDAAAYIHSGGLTQHQPLPCSIDGIRWHLDPARTAGAVYLLWFYYSVGGSCEAPADYDGHYAGLDELLAAVPLEPVAAFDDGVLFRYRPPSDAAAAVPDAAAAAAVDPRRDLRQHYAAIADGVPVAVSDSGFNLYLDDAAAPRWITYINDQCAADATQVPIYLSIVPANSVYLTGTNRQRGNSGYKFEFNRDGIRIGRQCMVSAPLPHYAIASIGTGQSDPERGRSWHEDYEINRAARLRAELAAARQAQSPIIQSDFEVYHHGGQLIYAKQPCSPADTAAPFFLHIVPVSAADLPESRRPHGFDNRDFDFDRAGALIDGRQCIATVALPEYDLSAIRTGQYVPDAGRLWAAEFAPAAP